MARSIEQRITRLEKLVEHLCKLADVKLNPCHHPYCETSGGYWQDGGECGLCHGTGITIKEKL